MSEEISIDSLREAIKSQRAESEAEDLSKRFEKKADRFEQAVAHINRQIEKVIRQIPELSIEFEDEEELFTSPAYPGMSQTVHESTPSTSKYFWRFLRQCLPKASRIMLQTKISDRIYAHSAR